jgi:hypothetical protein
MARCRNFWMAGSVPNRLCPFAVFRLKIALTEAKNCSQNLLDDLFHPVKIQSDLPALKFKVIALTVDLKRRIIMNLHHYKLTILAALALILISIGDTALAAGQKANAALTQAIAAGKKCQSNAVLVSLSSDKVEPDGTAAEWKYSFYSPGSNKRCVVTASKSGIRTKEVNLGFSTNPLGEFIDSDKAMQEAKKNGLKGNGPNMAVKFQGTGTGTSAGTYWIVNGGLKKGDVSVFLEAKTGKFFSRNVME